MLVFCNGMPRSASTWSYNVVLGLLRQATAGEVFGGYDENLEQFLQGLPASVSHAVVKCHSLNATGLRIAQLGSAKVIYTWRNLPDAIASQMTMFKVDFARALAIMAVSLDLYSHHRRHGAIILEYGTILVDPELSIREIVDYLELDVTDAQVGALAEATSFASMRKKVAKLGSLAYSPKLARHDGLTYDPATLLHVDHIRNGGIGYGRTMLSEDQLGQIDALLAEKDLLEMRNPLPPTRKRPADFTQQNRRRPLWERLAAPWKIFARKKGADSL